MDIKILETRSEIELKQVRENAIQKGRNDIVDKCDEILKARRHPAGNRGKAVIEFHFVCRKGFNLTSMPDGKFISGKWKVAEEHCERAVKIGALLALHEEKSEESYFQGQIVGYEKIVSERVGNSRIQFLVSPISQPQKWHGEGSGEKGYKYE